MSENTYTGHAAFLPTKPTEVARLTIHSFDQFALNVYIHGAAPSCAHSNAFWLPTFPWVGHGARSGPCSDGGAGTLLGHLRMKQNSDDTARYGINSDGLCIVNKVATRCLDRDGVDAWRS